MKCIHLCSQSCVACQHVIQCLSALITGLNCVCQELAEIAGDELRVRQLVSELDEIEEKATELEKRRIGNLNSITSADHLSMSSTVRQLYSNVLLILTFSYRYINQRNRMNNIRHAEEAMRKEYEESKNAGADPFTRQACRPVLGKQLQSYSIQVHSFISTCTASVYKTTGLILLATKTKKPEGSDEKPELKKQDSIDQAEQRLNDTKDHSQKVHKTVVTLFLSHHDSTLTSKMQRVIFPIVQTMDVLSRDKDRRPSEDLFNVHDFDITIDLDVPLSSGLFTLSLIVTIDPLPAMVRPDS